MAALAVAGGAPLSAADPSTRDLSLSISPSSQAPVEPAAVGRRVLNADGDTAGKCLTIEHNGAGPGIVMSACNDVQHQDWEYRFYTVVSGGIVEYDVLAIFSLHPSHLNKCIVPAPEGQQVRLETCSPNGPSLEQLWTYSNPIGGQWARFQSFPHWFFLTPKRFWCLDVKDNGLSYVVQTWECKGATTPGLGNQLWKVF